MGPRWFPMVYTGTQSGGGGRNRTRRMKPDQRNDALIFPSISEPGQSSFTPS